jgi:anti-sigma factor RsiW
MRKPLPLLVTLAPLSVALAGCIAVGAAAAGILVSQEVLDNNVYVATIDRDADQVWTSAKVALNRASLKPIEVQDDVRKAVADIDDAKVSVSVETYDLNRSTLRVSAKKYGVNNGEIAKMVYDKILHEIER